MKTLLYETLPLKTTAIFGEFDRAEIVPLVYGDMSTSPVPLARINLTDFALDGKIEQVVAVYVSGVQTTSYVVATKFTSTGDPYTLITLARPVQDSDTVSAAVKGKLSPKTGKLLENPADIMEDILSIAGITAIFPKLRSECSQQDIKLAGVLNTSESVQSHVDTVAGSCGAIWTTSAARLYPGLPSDAVESVDQFQIEEFSMPTNVGSYAASLRLSFDYNYAKNQPSRFMDLQANPSPFGGANERQEVMYLPWVRSAKTAQQIGTRALTRMASITFKIHMRTSNRKVGPTDWLLIEHTDIPVPGPQPMVILVSEKNPDSPDNYLEGEITLPTGATVSLVATSSEARLVQGADVQVQYNLLTKVASFTVKDSGGGVIEGAKVSVDNGDVVFTNAAGIANVSALQPGLHVLYVQSQGLVSRRAEITL